MISWQLNNLELGITTKMYSAFRKYFDTFLFFNILLHCNLMLKCFKLFVFCSHLHSIPLHMHCQILLLSIYFIIRLTYHPLKSNICEKSGQNTFWMHCIFKVFLGYICVHIILIFHCLVIPNLWPKVYMWKCLQFACF